MFFRKKIKELQGLVNSSRKSLEIAEEMYRNCEVVLDYTDFSGYEISEH